MTESTRLPSSLATWVESVLGPLNCVRDASHARDNSQVWRVTGPAGDHYVKVAPKPILYTRETCAYRVAVPHLGHANAPVPRDSSAELLALILTAVDGEPLKEEESPARRRVAHRQAGQLLRRFHDAMTGPLVSLKPPSRREQGEQAWTSTSRRLPTTCPPRKPTRCSAW